MADPTKPVDSQSGVPAVSNSNTPPVPESAVAAGHTSTASAMSGRTSSPASPEVAQITALKQELDVANRVSVKRYSEALHANRRAERAEEHIKEVEFYRKHAAIKHFRDMGNLKMEIDALRKEVEEVKHAKDEVLQREIDALRTELEQEQQAKTKMALAADAARKAVDEDIKKEYERGFREGQANSKIAKDIEAQADMIKAQEVIIHQQRSQLAYLSTQNEGLRAQVQGLNSDIQYLTDELQNGVEQPQNDAPPASVAPEILPPSTANPVTFLPPQTTFAGTLQAQAAPTSVPVQMAVAKPPDTGSEPRRFACANCWNNWWEVVCNGAEPCNNCIPNGTHCERVQCLEASTLAGCKQGTSCKRPHEDEHYTSLKKQKKDRNAKHTKADRHRFPPPGVTVAAWPLPGK